MNILQEINRRVGKIINPEPQQRIPEIPSQLEADIRVAATWGLPELVVNIIGKQITQFAEFGGDTIKLSWDSSTELLRIKLQDVEAQMAQLARVASDAGDHPYILESLKEMMEDGAHKIQWMQNQIKRNEEIGPAMHRIEAANQLYDTEEE